MYIRLKIAVCAILLSATMFSCVKEEIAESQMTYGDSIRFGISSANDKKGQPKTKSGAVESEPYVIHGEGITATVTVVDGIQSKMNDMPLTKGTQATSVSAFNVAAYLYPDGATSGVDYFSDLVSDGVNPATTRYWPEFGTLDFLAAAPAGIISTMPSASDYENGFSFTYAIPEEVADQQDIMVAVAKDQNNSSTGNPVPLQFQHLLAAVQFKVGEMQFIQINSLKITGVLGGDIKFTYDNATNVWTPDLSSASNNTSYSFIHDEANPSLSSLPSTSGLAKGAAITGNDYNTMLLVAPQTLTDAAQIEVNYTEVITEIDHSKIARLSGEWKAGMTTIYALNISGTDFGTIEIPRPNDQDAHYIMLEMSYMMGGLSGYISSVKASANWIDDNSKSSKDGISMLFKENLSDRQQKGYWVDEQWQRTVTVVDNEGNKTISDTTFVGNIRGSKDLDIPKDKLSKGTIVLFIEENNGTADREGNLTFEATLTTGKTVTLGEGKFKQLCPSWNDSNLGVERIEDGETSVHPYGFSYNRKVTYKLNWLGQLSAIASWFAASNLSNIAPDDGVFIKYNYGSVGLFGWTGLVSIEINYSALSNVNTIASNNDGLANTAALYNFTGGVDFDDIENALNQSDWLSTPTFSGTSDAPEDYAAYIALSRNRMYELKTITKASGQEDKVVYTAVLYRENSNDIIEWYLPSSEEAATLKEVGTGTEEPTPISPLNGEYWSSTAGSDADAQAHSYTFTNNTFGQINTTTDRMAKHKVRAVRKKPTAN